MPKTEVRKSIQLPTWDEEMRQKLVSFWQQRGIVFTEKSENLLVGKRGSLWGNLTSFDMSKLTTNLTISRSKGCLIECKLEINTVMQEITHFNRAYWQLELDTLESWLLFGFKRDAEWREFHNAVRKESVNWAVKKTLTGSGLPSESQTTRSESKKQNAKMLNLDPPVAFDWSDGWLLTALWGAGEPVNRERLNQVGDSFNHAYFTDVEVKGGMDRLVSAGLAEYSDQGLYAATAFGKLFVNVNWDRSKGHIANMFIVIDALLAESAGNPILPPRDDFDGE